MARRAVAVVAVRRPRDFRHHVVELRHRVRVCRGRDAARRIAPGGSGMLGVAFGVGFIVGPPVGALARRDRPARAVLGRGGPQSRQRGLRLLHPAGIAAGRAAVGLPLAPRQPDRIDATAAVAAAAHGARHGRLPVDARARSRCRSRSSSTRPIVYQWDQRTIGLVLAGVGVMSIVVQGGAGGTPGRRPWRAASADDRDSPAARPA